MLTSRRRASKAGLTLVELMVTLAILGLLLAATMPSINTWIRNTQIRGAAEALQTGLSKARNEAVRRNTRVFFSFVSDANAGSCTLSSSNASWIVSLQSPEGQCNATASETTAPRIIERWAQGESSTSVTMTMKAADCTSAASTTQAAFNGFGRLDTAAVAPLRCLVIDHASGTGNRTLRLVLSPAGAVRMCDPAVTDATDPRKC
ncbi:MAG: GspH/FimT family pseudopilin [Burkholderiales bacterium]